METHALANPTKEVANRLVDLCRRGEFKKAQKELYAENAVSIEEPMQGDAHKVQGRKALEAKEKQFEESFDVHGVEVSDPVIGGGYFSVSMTVDVTDKKSNQRFPMEEVAVYKVDDNKITEERFFYRNPEM